MAHSVSIPFFAFKLHLSEDNFLRIPLMDAQALRVNEPLHILAGQYAEQLQKKILNKGDFISMLNEYVGTDYVKDSVQVDFKKAKDGISYPNFTLEFDFYYIQQAQGVWGIVPAIGIDSFGYQLAGLKVQLQETIRLDFLRNNRLKWVREIIATIWQTEIDLVQENILLRFPSLKELSENTDSLEDKLLPKVAKKIQIDKPVVYGREKELEQLAKALKGKFTRNVLLVGPSGVGKTALIWEIIRQQKKQNISGVFWETTASVLIKELTSDTGWQDNLSRLCKEMALSGALLYVNNFMELFEVGKSEGNQVSVAGYLRSYISRGEVTLISECSEEELARIELNNPNYTTAFQIIRIEEPREKLEEIIIKKVKDLAEHRSINIREEAIQETLRLNKRFTPYSGLPGKPIRFLESILINQKQQDIKIIDRSAIIRYFCEETGMPLFMVDPSIPMNIDATRKRFNTNVFGQEQAVKSIINLLSSVKTALTRIGKPIASFLFVGPTGVGKTELAKILASFMFGSREKLIRFDMSEYSDPYAVTRLTGSSYQSDGLLTSAVRQEPFSVLLFDEIEKAHSNFFDLLLQLLSEGRLTDSRGQLVNFCSTIIIMTSNIGAEASQSNPINLVQTIDESANTNHYIGAVQRFFRPELYNRIDNIIPFKPLSIEVIRQVVEREINLFKQLEGIHYRKVSLELSPEVLDFLAKKGYHPKYGARQLQRTIREELIIPLAKELNAYEYEDLLIIKLSIQSEQLKIDIEADPLSMDLMMEELDKSAQIDIASDLRRTTASLEEGNAFVGLLNSLQELELLKKKKPKVFWQNQAQAAQYSHFLQLKEQFTSLQAQIENLEQQLSLSYMNLAPYRTTLDEQLKIWQKDFFIFKTALCSQLYPDLNTCYLAIYGLPPLAQYDLYNRLLEKQAYKIAVETLWFRAALYNEPIAVKNGDEKVQALIKGRYIKKEYVVVAFGVSNIKKFKAPKKGDIFVGIILKIEGPCAHLLLEAEGGMHLWRLSDKSEQKVIVQVSKTKLLTPTDIHRENFYLDPPARRTYEPDRFFDKLIKQYYDAPKGEYVPSLMEYLETAFKINLDKELF